MTRLQKSLITLLVLACIVFAGMCGWVYSRQQTMLFPAHAAPIMSSEWRPALGGNAQETQLDGSCGKLHAAMWEIPDSKGVILVFHGNAENLITVEDQVADFHRLGYSVAAWDYPGYGRSEECWFDEQDLLQDADKVFGWVRQQAGARPITLYGRSIGSAFALYIASHHPVHKVLLISPYDSLANVGRDHMPAYIPVSLLIRYPLNAGDWISRVKAPVHAIHGLNDTLIAPERARLLMERAGSNADITWVENAGHRASELFAGSPQWLEKHLSD
ncbi:MAG TPA: alpha/beta fold hydrolase [Methylophilaceae bacterium]|nr:alpha/beta fold hydrolase [Methylophilaceae bacterium]